MGSSDYLVLIALVVTIATIWNWYRVAMLKRRVAIAEKSTQIQTHLLEVLLEAKGLFKIVRFAIDNSTEESVSSEELKQISLELGQIIQSIADRVVWLQRQDIEDSAVLDEYKFYANQVRLKLMKISPMIKSIEAIPVQKKD